MSGDAFFDTNVLLYLLSGDARKAERSERLLLEGGVVSVQVLNEFASASSKKFKLSWPVIREALASVRANVGIVGLSVETHDRGLALAADQGFAVYDATIVAAAQLAGCRILYSEDMQHGRIIDGLTIQNPYV